MSVMTTIAAPTLRYPGAPKLRLFAGGMPARKQRSRVETADLRHTSELDVAGRSARVGAITSCKASDAPVLVAGNDATRRDAMVDELARTMAPGTRFTHAAASWEVLALAGSSSMVVLSGELEESSSASLMRMLSHRYPTLPVVSLDAERSLSAA
jgi:aconitase A